MANYQEVKEYFENLATLHTEIQHSADPALKRKRFYGLNIEEFLSGSHSSFDGQYEGAFIVFINYIGQIDQTGQGEKKNHQIMFYVLSNMKRKVFVEDAIVRSRTETVAEDFLRRCKKDSVDKHPLFQQSLNVLNGVRIIPAEITSGGSKYIGVQVSFMFKNNFPCALDASKWSDL